MSFSSTTFRPLATGSWGGLAYWRGALSVDYPDFSQPLMGPQTINPGYRGQVGTVIFRSLGIVKNNTLSGVTKDSTGAVLSFCRVEIFLTGSDTPVMEMASDASGVFSFYNPGSGPFYIVAYKAGAPDVAGTTVNTLVAV